MGRHVLQSLNASKLLTIKVLTEVDRVGVLFVADRLGMRSEFASEEFRLFGSLANTLERSTLQRPPGRRTRDPGAARCTHRSVEPA